MRHTPPKAARRSSEPPVASRACVGGTQARIATGLPSLAEAAGTGAIGPSDLDFSGRNGLLTIGLGRDPAGAAACPGRLGLASVAKIDANGGAVRLRDDIGAFETAVNPDRGAIDSNPHSLVKQANGTRDRRGRGRQRAAQHHVARRSSRRSARSRRGSTAATPTACRTRSRSGPDGAYYVGELTGVPFAPGAANIYRVAPPLGPQVWLTGFTSIIDLTFGKDGSLYVLQIATGAGPLAPRRADQGGAERDADDDPHRDRCSSRRRSRSAATATPTSRTAASSRAAGRSPATGHVLKVDL